MAFGFGDRAVAGDDGVRKRLEALERRVAALEAGAGTASGFSEPGVDGEIIALLQGGQKIQAIKVYRERNGVGLKEAKDAVDALASQYGR